MTEDRVKAGICEAFFILEDSRRLLVEAYSDEDARHKLVLKATAGIADALAVLQDEVYGDSAKVIGLDFPTRTGVIFKRQRDG